VLVVSIYSVLVEGKHWLTPTWCWIRGSVVGHLLHSHVGF
jgi:hypothetical protein